MALHYANKNSQANEDYEVHRFGCSWLPEATRTASTSVDFLQLRSCCSSGQALLLAGERLLLVFQRLPHSIVTRLPLSQSTGR